MQKKTVKKIVEAKMNDWLSTITDVNLRDRVKNNLLVSGGSIASLFQDIKVNDYDVYIQDRAVLKDLVIYYTKPYQIEVLDGLNKESYLESIPQSEEFESKFKNAVNSLAPDQIKLLVYSGYKVPEPVLPKTQYIDGSVSLFTITEQPKDLSKYRPLFFSPNALSLSDDVQVVCRFHGNAEQIHKTFDFIHATNYFTFKDGLVTNLEAVESLLTKQLKYQGSMYPLTTIIRIKKFLKRGWNISAGEMLKVMFQISELDLKDPAVLDDQLIGVDVAYFSTLVDILSNKQLSDPSFSLTSAYLNAVIDRVFDGADETEA